MNYTYFYKHNYQEVGELQGLPQYDVFISGYVNSQRVQKPADNINAVQKVWFATEEEEHDLYLAGKDVIYIKPNEDYNPIVEKLRSLQLSGKSVCIDATGFRIPYLMFLLRCMAMLNIKNFDVLYTEPTKYRCAENTQFSDLFYEVKQIFGMSGVHTSQNNNDLLIIAAGYDHSRIVDVANDKKGCQKKVLLFGFPAISPGMFQENILRAHEAESAIGTECFKDMDSNIYAPAYDPFVTAQAISEYIEKQEKHKHITNIYLSPLSTKPHAIGMALYFLWKSGFDKSMSLIYPYCQHYITDNSDGIARIWRYEIQLP
jgi:hypothetical protein